ncbi:MAG: YggS family pyridoxal phosphate-dependent enzyme [Candidatus Omnitrophica bacterium]|nr:YggS family pyridoxal phosphate-dependent enzyme [Candidatus Omnitrophota bacterium]
MIYDNIVKLKERIAVVCEKTGRKASSITVIAVSKGRTVEEIEEVLRSGIMDIGENRIQEARSKYIHFKSIKKGLVPRSWHFIGRLQTNKVKQAVGIFDLIHSVDSLKLAEEIDKEARAAGKVQDCLIQVNTSFEETKSGVYPRDLIPFFLEAVRLPNVRIRGVMTIAPMSSNPENIRGFFRDLSEWKEKLNGLQNRSDVLQIISMGMSDDFEVAIEEGATMVRIGRAIFSS